SVTPFQVSLWSPRYCLCRWRLVHVVELMQGIERVLLMPSHEAPSMKSGAGLIEAKLARPDAHVEPYTPGFWAVGTCAGVTQPRMNALAAVTHVVLAVL